MASPNARHLAGIVAILATACPSPRGAPPVLVTTAETSRFARTGRYDEAVRLCHDFALAYREASCTEAGRTVEDRPVLALRIARRDGKRRPTILVIAGIHAGEIEGKDAGFWFLRDLLDGKVASGALDAVDLVFVPVMNPDGHERFGPNNRPNQRGPAEMGFRTNAANLNLNRDWTKAEAPETRAVLGLVVGLDPVMLVDLHTTDGAKFEHDISVTVAPAAPRGDGLDAAASELSGVVMRRLGALGHLPVSFYPSFVDESDPASGFAIGEASPRFSNAYMAARGRLGVLVETHSWRTYGERARATYHALQAIAEAARTRAARWTEIARAADAKDRGRRGQPVPLVFDSGPHVREIEFRGYAYERRTSDLSGGTWLVYDEQRPQIWKVPLHDQLVPVVTVTAPRAGYIIDGGFAPRVAAVLDAHGLRHRPVRGGARAVPVEVFRATRVSYEPPFEGRTRVTLAGAWTRERRVLDRGAIFVPIDQPAMRLVLHLLEPSAPDSLAQWGWFNAVFERKEYMESYVLEAEARAMLEREPGLRAELDAAIAKDPELGKSPDKKLDWFYRRHPAWDERKDLLPVFRVDVAP